MRIASFVMAAALAWSGAASAQISSVDASTASAVVAKPVAFTKIISRLRDDQKVGTYLWGVICVQPIDVHWADISDKFVQLNVVFADELRVAGLKPDRDPNLLFADAEAASSDLEVGAIVKGIDMSVCSHLAGESGKLRLTMEWQIYSRLRREIIAKVETDQQVERKSKASNQERSIYQDAFAANARQLLATEAFKTAISATAAAPAPGGLSPASLTPISLASSKATLPVRDAVGSVVAIFAGDGHGSGFLVSDDGYLITNHHVVGGSKYVKVRWSDGFETVGEVIRSDKRRDVALVKTDPHGRSALGLRRGALQPGEAVFALGTPLDPKFQGTVTKGVMSSTRILDGFSYIQSDVTVNPGNSGGPLLDEKGAVIGITVLAYRPDDLPTGINLFIPIGDALDFLNLKPAA